MEDSESGAAATAAAEGSLPPRKRLLSSLKAGSTTNGSEGTNPPTKMDSTLIDSSPPSQVAPAITPGSESCSRCGSKDNSAWRRVKKSGVYQRLCNSCSLLYTMNMFCPYCLAVYSDSEKLGDPEVWLNCSQCTRSVHVACEEKNALPGATIDRDTYVCPECKKSPNGAKSEDNTDDVSPTSKKPRTVKAEGGESVGVPVSGQGEGQDAKPTEAPKDALTQAQEAAQAAKHAAVQAAKAAAHAKATALAKAQAAAKAAMAAKAALDAAAQAARAEIEARAELRRNGIRIEPRGYQSLMAPKVDTPDRKEESPGDEDLARQLHRAINNSPRNSRAPRRRPDGLSPGASPSALETKDDVRSVIVKEEHQGNHGLFQQSEAGAVDTQGFPSTYLSDNIPFDILAGFPSQEAGVIPGVTGVIPGVTAVIPGVTGEAMEVDQSGSQNAPKVEQKVDAFPKPDVMPAEQDLASKTDTDVSFFGAPDAKYEIPGKWNEDVKTDEKQQLGVEDYTVAEVEQEGEGGVANIPVDEPVTEQAAPVSTGDAIVSEAPQGDTSEELQGTQTATSSEAPADTEMTPVEANIDGQ